MAVQTPFFGKRDTDPYQARHAQNPQSHGATPATGSGLPAGAALPSGSAASGTAATAAAAAQAASARDTGGSKLTVGPNIKLKGVEITDCDTLVVEGMVEATMDSRVIQIAQQGAFKGSAEVDIAEIHGNFDGNLTVRDRLVIHATGKVAGTIRYGKVVIEEGGQISGEVSAGATVREQQSSPAQQQPAPAIVQSA